MKNTQDDTATKGCAPSSGSVMLLHEICGKNPVHPKTMMCMACNGPVFAAECIRFPLTAEWIAAHPQAAEFVISQNAPTVPTAD